MSPAIGCCSRRAFRLGGSVGAATGTVSRRGDGSRCTGGGTASAMGGSWPLDHTLARSVRSKAPPSNSARVCSEGAMSERVQKKREADRRIYPVLPDGVALDDDLIEGDGRNPLQYVGDEPPNLNVASPYRQPDLVGEQAPVTKIGRAHVCTPV